LRSGASDGEIAELFKAAVLLKEKGHRIGKADFVQPDRPMIRIGG
jgi:cyclic pyranopterin phosphate synthase